MPYRPLNAGRLDKRVTVQSSVFSDDGAGGQSIAWLDVATVWASIDTGSGREFMAAQQLLPELTHLVTIRYRDDVTAANRLIYLSRGNTRVLTIQSKIDPLERHEQLVLSCKEEVAP